MKSLSILIKDTLYIFNDFTTTNNNKIYTAVLINPLQFNSLQTGFLWKKNPRSRLFKVNMFSRISRNPKRQWKVKKIN